MRVLWTALDNYKQCKTVSNSKTLDESRGFCHSRPMQSPSPNAQLPPQLPRSPLNRDTDGFWGLLDGLLRRRDTFFEEIFEGREIGRRVRWYLLAIVMLSGSYGLTMGGIGMTGSWEKGLLQMLSSALKVPVLYLFSLGICFPVFTSCWC